MSNACEYMKCLNNLA